MQEERPNNVTAAAATDGAWRCYLTSIAPAIPASVWPGMAQ
jgi:hypothetical protein